MESSTIEEVAEERSRAEILHCSTKPKLKPKLNTTSWLISFPILFIDAKFYIWCEELCDLGVCVSYIGSLPSQRD